jgi:hypothetical protein
MVVDRNEAAQLVVRGSDQHDRGLHSPESEQALAIRVQRECGPFRHRHDKRDHLVLQVFEVGITRLADDALAMTFE